MEAAALRCALLRQLATQPQIPPPGVPPTHVHDGCVVLKAEDARPIWSWFDNNYAQFGGGLPAAGDEPVDLRVSIAGHEDPISRP